MNRALIAPVCVAFLLGGVLGWGVRARLADPMGIAPLTGEGASGTLPEVAFRTSRSPLDGDAPATTPERSLPFLDALQQGVVTAELKGNARDQLRMTAVNRSSNPVRITLPAGQAFESSNGYVVIPRALHFDFLPGQTRLDDLATLAVASTNQMEIATFVASPTRFPRLDELLHWLADHPEISLPAAQTAALVILENLPSSAFARYATAGSDLPSLWESGAFKVDTADLIEAMLTLRRMGLPDEQLAITVDPQTRIEAMLDPLARADAMVYYDITPANEWAFWRKELQEGDPSTRHYALHGIARYFPKVALEMLPKWAREKRTPRLYRLVAIRALAETRQPEAVGILNALAREFGVGNELGQAAQEAALFLEASEKQPPLEAVMPVRFRLGE